MVGKVRVVALTGGTAGDVNPFMGIGTEIVKQGHSFVLCANEYFKQAAEKRDLEFEPTGKKEKYTRMIERPNNWDEKSSLLGIWQKYIFPYMDQYLTCLNKAVDGKEVLLLSTPGMVPAIIFRDIVQCPLMAIGLSPMQFDPLVDPQIVGRKELGQRVWAAVQRLYDTKNLSLGHQSLEAFKYSADLNFGLWPQWFCKSRDSWFGKVTPLDFVIDDGGYKSEVSVELQKVLRKKPVLCTGGSGVRSTHMYEPVIDATQKLGKDLIIVTHDPQDLPEVFPGHVTYVQSVPFAEVFPFCSAIVQPGGMGTAARAMQAGVPQLLTPYTADHFQNSDRLKFLSAGDTWLPNEDMESKLNQVLNAKKIQSGLKALKDRFAENRNQWVAKVITDQAKNL